MTSTTDIRLLLIRTTISCGEPVLLLHGGGVERAPLVTAENHGGDQKATKKVIGSAIERPTTPRPKRDESLAGLGASARLDP
jgi:hypothetical protein